MERLMGFSFFLEGSILTTLLLVKEKERRKKRKSATKKEKKMGGHQKVRAQFTDLRRAEYCAGRTFACFQQGEQTKKKKKKRKTETKAAKEEKHALRFVVGGGVVFGVVWDFVVWQSWRGPLFCFDFRCFGLEGG